MDEWTIATKICYKTTYDRPQWTTIFTIFNRTLNSAQKATHKYH